jgi:patatin-related protein
MALLTPLSALPARPAPTPVSPGGSPNRRELRLAVVCDGGVSLAIYEHGVIKELQHAVIASRAFDEVQGLEDARPAARANLKGSQRFYFDALAAAEDIGAPRSIVIDVISGTSAGGINGVCLAKGLARNASQDPLTKIWLESADLRYLAPGRWPGSVKAKLIQIGLAILRNTVTENWSPLSGTVMCRLLLKAMREMTDKQDGVRSSLMPAGHDLDLFVTTTDLRGYVRTVPSPDGGPGEYDRVHRKLFHFAAPAGNDESLGASDNGGLAFAARCTSSFPGAFAPGCLEDFVLIAAAEKVAFNQGDFTKNQLAEYPLSGLDPATVRFSDGGLLDNQPFDHVLTAISAKRAQSQVVRRIVHVDPNQNPWPDPTAPQATKPAEPYPYLRGGVAALLVKAGQSTAAQLVQVQELNDVIDQVGKLVDDLELELGGWLAKVTSGAAGWDLAQAKQAAAQVRADLKATADSSSLNVYQQLKVATIADMFAADLAAEMGFPAETQPAAFLRQVMDSWFTTGAFLTQGVELGEFLDRVDMPYRERRLRFVLSTLDTLYKRAADEGKVALDRLKSAAWDVLNDLVGYRRTAVGTVATGDFRRLIISEAYSDAVAFAATTPAVGEAVAAYAQALSEYDGDAAEPLWTQLVAATGPTTGLADERGRLVGRYVAFPMWDAAIFPVIALSRLPQLTEIELTRLSPAGATRLTPPVGPKGGPAPAKLLGAKWGHFAGFLDRRWRENDYLWGRLDAVEQILGMLGQPAGSAAVTHGLLAVLEQEQDNLTKISADLFPKLRAQLGTSLG